MLKLLLLSWGPRVARSILEDKQDLKIKMTIQMFKQPGLELEESKVIVKAGGVEGWMNNYLTHLKTWWITVKGKITYAEF